MFMLTDIFLSRKPYLSEDCKGEFFKETTQFYLWPQFLLALCSLSAPTRTLREVNQDLKAGSVKTFSFLINLIFYAF